MTGIRINLILTCKGPATACQGINLKIFYSFPSYNDIIKSEKEGEVER
jgi:hypothetical protein